MGIGEGEVGRGSGEWKVGVGEWGGGKGVLTKTRKLEGRARLKVWPKE